MKGKDLLLLGTIVLGLTLVVKVLQVVLTPEAWGLLAKSGVALLQSSAVGFLLVATAILSLLSLIAVAWDRAERRHEAEGTRRAELAARGYTALPTTPDTSSLIDDSPRGPLPESFRAPRGEVVRFSNQNDRGPRAA